MNTLRCCLLLALTATLPMQCSWSKRLKLCKSGVEMFFAKRFTPTKMLLRHFTRFKASFTRIAGDHIKGLAPHCGVTVQQDDNGNILAIHDGKKSPLLLGTIIGSKVGLDHLKKQFGVTQVTCCSFNREFERNWTGQTQLAKDKDINLIVCPTIDHCAPSLINNLRCVQAARNRTDDANNAFEIHCKAGKGRSAVGACCYVITTLHEDGMTNFTADHAINYVQRKRPLVSLNPEQRQAVINYHEQLKKAGSFSKLCAQHADEMARRDKLK